jgi:hypothetical protein
MKRNTTIREIHTPHSVARGLVEAFIKLNAEHEGEADALTATLESELAPELAMAAAFRNAMDPDGSRPDIEGPLPGDVPALTGDAQKDAEAIADDARRRTGDE